MQQNKILGKKTIYQLLCQRAEGSGILEELKGHLVCPVRILQEFEMNSVQILEKLLGQTKDLSIEGAVVPGLLLCSKFIEQSKSPGTTVPSIERSLM